MSNTTINTMKRLTTNLKLVAAVLTVGLAMLVACNDEAVVEKPLAFFTFEADAENSQLIVFTNETENGDSYVWDFGDGSATSTDVNPTHEYADGGDYTVTLTATNAGGNNVYSNEITVIAAAAENLVQNGSFDDDTNWTFISLYKTDNTTGNLGVTDGNLLFSENDSETWKHQAAYQEMTLEAGNYTIDMMVDYASINQIWGEAYVGQTVPTAGTADADSDYSDNLVLNFWNGWDCGDTYSGSAVALACKGSDGTFSIAEAGTYYLVIKSGGLTYGPNGAKIDEVTIYKQ